MVVQRQNPAYRLTNGEGPARGPLLVLPRWGFLPAGRPPSIPSGGLIVLTEGITPEAVTDWNVLQAGTRPVAGACAAGKRFVGEYANICSYDEEGCNSLDSAV